MLRRGKRSQAQQMRRRKEDLEDEQTRLSKINKVEQANTSAAEAQFSDRMHAEGGDGAPRVLSVQASHCQSDVRKSLNTIAVLSKTGSKQYIVQS